MSDVQFPTVQAACRIQVTTKPTDLEVESTPDAVIVRRPRPGSSPAVRIDTDGMITHHGSQTDRLEASELRGFSAMMDLCADGLSGPKQQSVRSLGARLEEIAKNRSRVARCGTGGCA